MILQHLVYICDEPGCRKVCVVSDTQFLYNDTVIYLPDGWEQDSHGSHLCPDCAPKEPTPWPLEPPCPVVERFAEIAMESVSEPLVIPRNKFTEIPLTEREPGSLQVRQAPDSTTHHTFIPKEQQHDSQ